MTFNIISIVFFLTMIFGCTSNDEIIQKKITHLEVQNDSLLNVLEQIKGKYIFDSIAIHQKPNKDNTKKINSVYKTDFFIVGYGADNLEFVECDSIDYNPLKLHNAKKLKHNRGIFSTEKRLDKKLNKLKVRVVLKSKYGASKKSVIEGTIKAK